MSAVPDDDSSSQGGGWSSRAWVAIVGAAILGAVGGGLFAWLVFWPDQVGPPSPERHVVLPAGVYVALGDSYSAGEGLHRLDEHPPPPWIGRYQAGLVLVDDVKLVAEQSLAAPKDVSLAGQLDELYRRTRDLISEWKPDMLILGVTDHAGTSSAAVARRAEGAILAAAGQKGLPMDTWSGPKLRGAAYGRGPGTNVKAANHFNRTLDRQPSSNETGFAAAVARGYVATAKS
jgi:Holliday junction resolvasome RuvABC endonuclease subunit